MSGYLNFNYTGVDLIDGIISELEYAGNSYHHTEYWGDEDPRLDNKSHLDLIQDALDKAADALRKEV